MYVVVVFVVMVRVVKGSLKHVPGRYPPPSRNRPDSRRRDMKKRNFNVEPLRGAPSRHHHSGGGGLPSPSSSAVTPTSSAAGLTPTASATTRSTTTATRGVSATATRSRPTTAKRVAGPSSSSSGARTPGLRTPINGNLGDDRTAACAQPRPRTATPQAKPIEPPSAAMTVLNVLGEDSEFDDSMQFLARPAPSSQASSLNISTATRPVSAFASRKRLPTSSAGSRPSTALSRTTRDINADASAVWRLVEEDEQEHFSLIPPNVSPVTQYLKSQSPGLFSGTSTMSPSFLTNVDSIQERSPKASSPARSCDATMSNMSWAQLMTIQPEAVMDDPAALAARREDSNQTWSRLWKPNRSTAANIPVHSPKRLGTMQRVEQLRQNPAARRALNAEITQRIEDARKEEMEKRGNIRMKNIMTVNKYASYFAQAKRATASLRLQSAIENAEQKRQGLQSWRTARTVDALQRADFTQLQRTHELEHELLTNSWSTFIFASIALCEMHDRMVDQMRMSRSPSIRRFTQPGAVLQENIHARQTIRLVRASVIIWNWWKRKRLHIRESRTESAATIIRRFLTHIGESIRIPIAVKKKLKFVRMIQRKFRFQKESFDLRVDLCVSQLERALKALYTDDEMEINKLKSLHRQYERDTTAKRGLHRLQKNEMIAEHRVSTDKQVVYLVRRQHTIGQLPADLKVELVREFLAKKRHDYSNQVYRYGIALRHHYRDLKREQEKNDDAMATSSRRDVLRMLRSQSPRSSRSVSFGSPPGSPGSSMRKSSLVPPIKPCMSILFKKDEVAKLVGVAMDRMQQQVEKEQKEEALKEAVERQKAVEEMTQKLLSK